jgi:hypothetical protein
MDWIIYNPINYFAVRLEIGNYNQKNQMLTLVLFVRADFILGQCLDFGEHQISSSTERNSEVIGNVYNPAINIMESNNNDNTRLTLTTFF